MKKNNKQTLDMLKGEFGKSVDEIRVPERLQKNNIVEMLENSKTDFSDKTGTIIQLDERRRSKSDSNATLRKSLSIAAMLIIVIGCSLLIKMSGDVNIIRTEPTLNNYNAENMFKAAENYEEVEKAIQNIFNPSSDKPSSDTSSATNSGSSAPSSETTSPDQPVTNKYSELGEYVIDNTSPVPSVQQNADPNNGVSGLTADIVKNDGKNLYVLTNVKDPASGKTVDCINVISASPVDSMQVASTIILGETASASSTSECTEVYLHGNTLIAILSKRTNEATEEIAYTKHQTAAVYYDISDPAAPVKMREFVQDGSYVTSFVSSTKLCLVTDDKISEEIKDIVPSYSINGSETLSPAAGNIYIATNNPQAARVFMTAFDISGSASESEIPCAVFIGSNGESLFASHESLLIERTFVSVNADENGVHDNLTEIYRFDIIESSIQLVGSYIVDGTLCCEPSVDPATGNLRVVSSGKDGSALYILSKNMEFIGWYDGMAAQIKSVRFVENVCYIETDGAEDAALAIDISNPEKPQKLNSVSDTALPQKAISIGNGLFVQVDVEQENAIIVSLYNTSDPKNVTAADTYKILGNFSPSPFEDSRSVMIWEESETFAIPAISFNAETSSAVSSYALFSYSGGNLAYIGNFDHDANSNGNGATKCVRIGDSLYTVSGEKIVAFSISQKQQLSVLEFN